MDTPILNTSRKMSLQQVNDSSFPGSQSPQTTGNFTELKYLLPDTLAGLFEVLYNEESGGG
jgi:hypothetical protein